MFNILKIADSLYLSVDSGFFEDNNFKADDTMEAVFNKDTIFLFNESSIRNGKLTDQYLELTSQNDHSYRLKPRRQGSRVYFLIGKEFATANKLEPKQALNLIHSDGLLQAKVIHSKVQSLSTFPIKLSQGGHVFRIFLPAELIEKNNYQENDQVQVLVKNKSIHICKEEEIKSHTNLIKDCQFLKSGKIYSINGYLGLTIPISIIKASKLSKGIVLNFKNKNNVISASLPSANEFGAITHEIKEEIDLISNNKISDNEKKEALFAYLEKIIN